MAVTMIIGNSNAFSWSLLSPGYTISSMLANQFGEADGSQVSSLFYAAFVLMILSLVVMLLPIVTAIARDSLNQVPRKLRNAAYGIGASRWKTIFSVILPAALSGIMAGVLLALGRAMGETMAVTMIIGNSNVFSWSLLSPGYTISSMLANQFGEADGSQVSSLFYAAFVLMTLSLVVNIFAQWLVKKFSLKY